MITAPMPMNAREEISPQNMITSPAATKSGLMVLYVITIDVLALPNRISARHGRDLREVVLRWRTRNRPLQSPRAPRIRARDFPALPALEEVVDEDQRREREDHRARGRHCVEEVPALSGVEGVDPARHSEHSR